MLRATRGHGPGKHLSMLLLCCVVLLMLGKMLLCLIRDHPDKDLVFTRLVSSKGNTVTSFNQHKNHLTRDMCNEEMLHHVWEL